MLARILPEVPPSEGMAGAILQVAFEGLGLGVVGEVEGNHDPPWRMGGCVWRLAGVVLLQSAPEVAC